eukprot:CAMPEP_0113508704 /NCGR_PEP_ID=MMETSP0014_2-20120614/37167_1 /TAXON_ID=2857 /ORGANISM="Nitzschia sp." /LENGTH=153 /DNA_ID=CAMNT_0000404451 /DNA_START=1392 /DNA_END=1853 /DNA_ORIENTATION=+ /assembly_acc=CAM_ASM_000159
MKTSIIASVIGIALVSAGVEGFAPPPVSRTATNLAMSAAASTKNEIDRKYIRKTIEQLTAENFDAKLQEIEPFLKNEAGVTFLAKCQRRISRTAKVLGKSVPADYLKEAKATAKRREKQAAFIQSKIDEAASGSDDEEEGGDAPAEEEAPAEE